jgi:hypothetical protein
MPPPNPHTIHLREFMGRQVREQITSKRPEVLVQRAAAGIFPLQRLNHQIARQLRHVRGKLPRGGKRGNFGLVKRGE